MIFSSFTSTRNDPTTNDRKRTQHGMKLDLQNALSAVMNKKITKAQEIEVRKKIARGIADDEICMNTLLGMMDHLSESDTQMHERQIITEQKLLLQGIPEKINPCDRDLLGMEKIETGESISSHEEITSVVPIDHDEDFESVYTPQSMRYLALISQSGMRDTMRKFIISNKNLLSKFILTGDDETMTMLCNVYQGNTNVVYRPRNDDKVVSNYTNLTSLMSEGRIGGIIVFEDPGAASNCQQPYDADLDELCELSLAKNVMILNNPTTALIVTNTIRTALKVGKGELIPSFFLSLQHPSVAVEQPMAADSKEGNDLQSQIEQLTQKLAEAIEENHKLTLALNNAELKAYDNYNELVSIVEGVMDVDTKEADFILKQLQAQNRMAQMNDRDSPLTVTDEIVKPSELQKSEMTNSISIANSDKSTARSDFSKGVGDGKKDTIDQLKGTAERARDVNEVGNRDSTDIVETFDISIVEDVHSDDDGDPAMRSDVANPEGNAGSTAEEKDIVETFDISIVEDVNSDDDGDPAMRSDVANAEGNAGSTAEEKGIVETFDISIVEDVDSDFDRNENIFLRFGATNAVEDTRSVFTEDEDLEQDIDTESVVYDFARPVTAPSGSRSTGSKFALNFISSLESPRLSTTSFPRRSTFMSVKNTNYATLSMNSSSSIFSASSRRDQAFENLKKRFQAFATNP